MASGGGRGAFMAGAVAERGDPVWDDGCEPSLLLGAAISAGGIGLSGTTRTSIEGRGVRGVICSTATPTVPSRPQHSDRSRCPQNDWNSFTPIPTIVIRVALAPPAFRASVKSIAYLGFMDYVIAVRTYKRPAMFQRFTLKVLREQHIDDRLYVFVGSDIEEYRALEPDLRYIQAPVGSTNAHRTVCEYFPRGTPIVFFDDDLESFFRYDKETDSFKHDGLHDLIVQGFEHAPFTFQSITNRLWLRGAKELFRPIYSTMAGSYFAAFNEPEHILVPLTHCEEISRTVSYLKAGRIPWSYIGAGFKTKYAKNPGGITDSGDRKDTRGTCESLLPLVADWVRPEIFQQPCGIWTLRLLPATTLKKKVKALATSDCLSSPTVD